MELAGLEPATSWVRSRRSPKLSYSPGEGFDYRFGPRASRHGCCNLPCTTAPVGILQALLVPMGSLDDAIREHLELKRQHGASDEELEQQGGRGLRPRPPPGAGGRRRQRDDRAGAGRACGRRASSRRAEPHSNGQPAEHARSPTCRARRAASPEPFEPDEVPRGGVARARADGSGRPREAPGGARRRAASAEARAVERPARGDPGVPRGDARGGPALVRAAAARRTSTSTEAEIGRGPANIADPFHCVRAAPLRGAHLSRSSFPAIPAGKSGIPFPSHPLSSRRRYAA